MKMSGNSRVCPACSLKLPNTLDICPVDQTPLVDSVLLPPAAIWDRYQFLDVVGKGGMGVIYKARNLLVDHIVAIKMLHANSVSDKSLQRFQHEGKALSRLNHPNIVTLHDFGITEQNRPYMIMDYLEGETLDSALRKETAFSEAKALDIFTQIADGMAYAHAEGVLHRDLKPSNIMLQTSADGTCRVKIFDFGIAKLMHEDSDHKLTKTGEMVGSPAYMSPEQIMDKEVDHRSDLYSFGVLMYEALTGKPPFTESSLLSTLRNHLNEKPPSLYEASQKTFLPELEAIVMRLLSKEPSARYQSMAELKTELDRAKVALGKTSDNRRFWHAQLRRAKFNGKLVPAMAMLTAILMLAFVTVTTHPVKKQPVEQLAPSSSVSPASTPEENSFDGAAKRREIVEEIARSGAVDINLKQMNLQDDDLSPLKEVANALKIDLSLNQDIHDQGLKNLEHVPVQQIELVNTQVKTLDWLRNNKTITYLNVAGTRLSDDGYKNIATLVALQNLNLNKSTVNDENLSRLISLKKLKLLYLLGCASITEEGVNRLHKALPDCKIFAFDPSEVLKTYGKQAEQLENDGMWSDALAVYKQGEQTLNKLPKLANGQLVPYSLAENLCSQADCYAHMDRFDNAVNCCERGEKLAAAFPKLLRQLYVMHGRIEARLRNHAAEENFFRRALKLPSFRDDNAQMQFLLGTCLLDQNKVDDARTCFETALQEMPAVTTASDSRFKSLFAECNFHLALAETKLGNHAAALNDLQKAYEYRPQNVAGESATIMTHYANALEKAGNISEARARWQELKLFCQQNPSPLLDNIEVTAAAALKRIGTQTSEQHEEH